MMADDILQSISKKTYRGVWTKKYRKYMNLKFKSINSWKSWEGLDASLDD